MTGETWEEGPPAGMDPLERQRMQEEADAISREGRLMGGTVNPLTDSAGVGPGGIAARACFCRACGSAKLEDVADFGSPRINGFPLEEEPLPPEAPLVLARCHGCGLAQLRHTVPADLCYRDYWYRSGTTETMRGHLRLLASWAMLHHGDGLEAGDTVLDIGCNDGTLLSLLPMRFKRVGFDPARNLTETAREAVPGGVVVPDYFSSLAWNSHRLLGKDRAKLVIAAAMFYDLEDPVSFLRDVANVMQDGGTLVIQVAWAAATYDMLDIGNVCHEHLTYWHLGALRATLARAGFGLFRAEVWPVNGGSLVVAARLGGIAGEGREDVERILEEEEPKVGEWGIMKFAERAEALACAVRAEQERLAGLPGMDGTLGVLGASTKGNYMLQRWGLGPDRVILASERDERKWGRRTANGIPIACEEHVRAKCRSLLVLPWHFRKEIVERERNWIEAGGRLLFPNDGLWVADREGFRRVKEA